MLGKGLMQAFFSQSASQGVANDLRPVRPRSITAVFAVGVVAISIEAVFGQTGTLPGKASVGNGGAFTYSIPIAVPPGTAGMSPSLSIDYNSKVGNGILGVGWSLAGLPMVDRCPRTLAQDGVRGGINLDSSDRFCLDGQRLVAIVGAYGADGTEYRTEIESFSRIVSYGAAGVGPAWFEVRTKTGQIMEFGRTPDSQVLVQGVATSRAWTLNKVSDTKGNDFSVTYTRDVANGSVYPSRIDYTGNAGASLAAYNSVRFVYGSRSDIIPSYRAGALIQTALRLTNIQTYAGNSLVSDYRLAFQQGTTSQRSQLASIKLCDNAGSCLPATSLNWTEASSGLGNIGAWLANQYGAGGGWTNGNIYPRFIVDVTGDGLPDVVGFGGAGILVSPNTGTGFGQPQSWQANYGAGSGWTDSSTYPRYLEDVNGDGLPDVVAFGGGGILVSLNTGTSFTAPQSWLANQYGAGGGWADSSVYPRFVVDVNGDGLPDVVGFGGAGVLVSLNTGTSFGTPQSWLANQYGAGGGWTDSSAYPRFVVDVNGDGLPDVVGFGGAGILVSLNTGTSFGTPQSWQANYGAGSGWTDSNTYPRYLDDVNGDGLPDVIGFGGSGILVSLNTGTSFGPPQSWLANQFGAGGGWTDNYTYPRFLADMNGDGLPDVVGFGGAGILVSLNTGTGFGAPQSWSASFGAGTTWANQSIHPRVIADVKGTGFAGVVGIGGDGVYVSVNTANGPLPDLLSGITTGLGAVTSITYSPATNTAVVTKGTGTAFPTYDLIGPAYVVSRIDASNGVGGNYSTSYKYDGGRIDQRGRGFLGFEKVSATDLQTGVVGTTNYLQSFPYIGAAGSTTKKASTLLTLSQTVNTYQFNNASNGSTVSAPSVTSAPYRVSVAQSVASGADLDGTSMPTTTTTFQYDVYGNATQVGVSNSDGYSKATNNNYTNDVTKWLLGRLTNSSVGATSP